MGLQFWAELKQNPQKSTKMNHFKSMPSFIKVSIAFRICLKVKIVAEYVQKSRINLAF